MNNVIKDTIEQHILLSMTLFMIMLGFPILESSDHKSYLQARQLNDENLGPFINRSIFMQDLRK